MAPVVRQLEADHRFESRVCVTAQHRDMLDQVLDLFELVPHHDLNLMRPGQNLHDLTARVLTGLRPILEEEKPDVMLVQGDTTTVFTGALAAFYSGVAVGHVEAGLRTGNLRSPFPEEANRVLADRITDYYFAPTSQSRDNLLAEGVDPKRVWLTGNTVIDALLWVRDRVASQPISDFKELFGSVYPYVAANETPIILVTGHRRESFGSGFQNICTALATLAQRHPHVQIVYPVHLNPNVQGPVHRTLADLPNVHLLPPLDYAPFVRLMDSARFILTDSGGVQEEAPSLGKPVLVMREVTERPEGVAAGTVRLVGTETADIVSNAELLLTNTEAFASMQGAHNPYGDGLASERIAEALVSQYAPQA